MIKNYLKIAFRNIVRHRAFAMLNIAGLAIGMTCSILILLWVQNELSYDRFHANAGELYRLTASAEEFRDAVTPAGVAAGLQQEMPAIETTVRMSKPYGRLLEVGTRKFQEDRVFYVDSNFLQAFTFQLRKGNSTTALSSPNSVLITEAMAKKYFGADDPLGKVIRQDNTENLTVTGVLENAPPNSHLQYDFIMPISSIAATNYDLKNKVWDNFNFYTYIQLQKNVDRSQANIAKLTSYIDKLYKARVSTIKIAFHLQPLTAIHLHSDMQIDLPGHGNIQYVNIFFIVALFILAVACINFMNLATARSSRRAKEVGLRKVVGAGRNQLILQF